MRHRVVVGTPLQHVEAATSPPGATGSRRHPSRGRPAHPLSLSGARAESHHSDRRCRSARNTTEDGVHLRTGGGVRRTASGEQPHHVVDLDQHCDHRSSASINRRDGASSCTGSPIFDTRRSQIGVGRSRRRDVGGPATEQRRVRSAPNHVDESRLPARLDHPDHFGIEAAQVAGAQLLRPPVPSAGLTADAEYIVHGEYHVVEGVDILIVSADRASFNRWAANNAGAAAGCSAPPPRSPWPQRPSPRRRSSRPGRSTASPMRPPPLPRIRSATANNAPLPAGALSLVVSVVFRS